MREQVELRKIVQQNQPVQLGEDFLDHIEVALAHYNS
jgi:hypothetical protein